LYVSSTSSSACSSGGNAGIDKRNSFSSPNNEISKENGGHPTTYLKKSINSAGWTEKNKKKKAKLLGEEVRGMKKDNCRGTIMALNYSERASRIGVNATQSNGAQNKL
jgi:hypothetical protein